MTAHSEDRVGEFDPILAVRSGAVPAHLELTVVGLPGPQGSKTRYKFGMVESSKAVKPWREAVVEQALAFMGFDEASGQFAHATREWPLRGPLIASMVFTLPISKAKEKAGRKARQFADSNGRNDVSKLCRSTEDALVTSGSIEDDGRLVEFVRLAKVLPGWDPEALAVPGARVRVWSIQELFALDAATSG